MVPEAWLLRLAVWVDCEGARVHLLPGTLEGGERWTMSGGEVHAHREVTIIRGGQVHAHREVRS